MLTANKTKGTTDLISSVHAFDMFDGNDLQVIQRGASALVDTVGLYEPVGETVTRVMLTEGELITLITNPTGAWAALTADEVPEYEENSFMHKVNGTVQDRSIAFCKPSPVNPAAWEPRSQSPLKRSDVKAALLLPANRLELPLYDKTFSTAHAGTCRAVASSSPAKTTQMAQTCARRAFACDPVRRRIAFSDRGSHYGAGTADGKSDGRRSSRHEYP